MIGAAKKNSSIKNPLETFEALDDFGLRELKQTGKDLGKGFFDQLFGVGEQAKPRSHGGDLKPGQELQLGAQRGRIKSDSSEYLFGKSKGYVRSAETMQRPDIAPGIDYHREIATIDQRASRKETDEIKRAVQEIQVELQRLVSSSSLLQVEFSKVTMQQAPTTPGKYHVNFFEWVLSVIKQARMKVEDAGAWQVAIKGKGGKRGYWNRAKKEGTTFLLHHDRNVATQTG